MITGKTIFIAHNWDDSGVRAQAKILALYLSLHNKVIFLSAHKKGDAIKIINNNLVVYEWPGQRPTGVRDFGFAFSLMRKHKADIIITNFAANNVMLFASWLLKVPVRICHFHTMVEQYLADKQSIGVRQKLDILKKGVIFKMATHMLPCSSAAKKDLIKYFGIKESVTFVFFNAVVEQPQKNNATDPLIGFIGRLDRSKGVDVLINAFSKVVKKVPAAKLVVAGQGKEEDQLKQMVTNLQLQNKVTFAGLLGYKKIFDFFRSLNLLAVPSRTDNLPTVVLEAFSCSTPVVASNAGGIPDMISDGYNGLLFENEDVNELAEKMLVLLQDSEERNRLMQNSAKVFEENFWIKNYAQRYEAFIEKHGNL